MGSQAQYYISSHDSYLSDPTSNCIIRTPTWQFNDSNLPGRFQLSHGRLPSVMPPRSFVGIESD